MTTEEKFRELVDIALECGDAIAKRIKDITAEEEDEFPQTADVLRDVMLNMIRLLEVSELLPRERTIN